MSAPAETHSRRERRPSAIVALSSFQAQPCGGGRTFLSKVTQGPGGLGEGAEGRENVGNLPLYRFLLSSPLSPAPTSLHDYPELGSEQAFTSEPYLILPICGDRK